MSSIGLCVATSTPGSRARTAQTADDRLTTVTRSEAVKCPVPCSSRHATLNIQPARRLLCRQAADRSIGPTGPRSPSPGRGSDSSNPLLMPRQGWPRRSLLLQRDRSGVDHSSHGLPVDRRMGLYCAGDGGCRRLRLREHAVPEAEAQPCACRPRTSVTSAAITECNDASPAGPNRAGWGAAETGKPVLNELVRGAVRGATPKSRRAGVPWVYEIP